MGNVCFGDHRRDSEGKGRRITRKRRKKSLTNSHHEEAKANIPFMYAVDKAYTSFAKATLYGIDYEARESDSDTDTDTDKTYQSNGSSADLDNSYQVNSDTHNDNFSTCTDNLYQAKALRIAAKSLNLLNSESFLRTIESGDVKSAIRYLNSHWTDYAGHIEAVCTQKIVKAFHLDIGVNIASGVTNLTLATKTKNAKVFSLKTSALFFNSIQRGDVKMTKRFLNSSRTERAMRPEHLCIQSSSRNQSLRISAFDVDCILGSCISFFDWLEGVYIANKCKCIEIIDLLFNYEKIVCGATEDGWTALHLAMFQCRNHFGYGELKKIVYLLESGKFDVNAVTGELETVLHFASRCQASPEGSDNALQKLILSHLCHKVDISQKNILGQTALMTACRNGNVAAVDALLNPLAIYVFAIDVKDNDGQNALSVAKQSDNAEILAMVEQAFILSAVIKGDTQSIEIYLNAYAYDDKIQRDSADDDLSDNPTENRCSPKKISKFNHSNWLKAVNLAHEESQNDILKLISTHDRFLCEFNEDGQTVLHVAVKESLDYFDREHINFYADDDSLKLGTNCPELEMITILLDYCKCDINVLNRMNESVLHFLCQTGEPRSWSRWKKYYTTRIEDLLKIFLEYRIDVNCGNSDGKTALMLACENKFSHVACRLLAMSRAEGIYLDIDAVDNSGETALMKATRTDNWKTAMALLKFAFLRAVENQNVVGVKSMLDLAENDIFSFVKTWNVVDGEKRKEYRINFNIWLEAVHIAIEKCYENILKLLLDYDFVVQSQTLETGLSECASILHHLVFKTFAYKYEFDEGTYFYISDQVLCTPTDFESRQLCLIEILLKSGKVNANAIYAEAQTVLHNDLFDDEFNEKIIKLFLQHGANINQKDAEGVTPLMIASGTGCVSTMRTIFNWANETGTSIDVDARDCNGKTALIRAVLGEHPDAVRALLDSNASVNLPDNCGLTALHHALGRPIHTLCLKNFQRFIHSSNYPRNFEERKKIQNIVATLADSGILRFRDTRCNKKQLKTLKLLLKKKDVDVNALNCEGFSALDIVEAWIPRPPISIKRLLKTKGAKLSAFNKANRPSPIGFDLAALDHSGSSGRIIRQLLCKKRKKEIISYKDQKQRTLLHHASMFAVDLSSISPYIEYKWYRIVKLLISLGCNVNAADIYGRTPLHYAYSETSLQKLLLSKGADQTIKDGDGIGAIEMAKTPQEPPIQERSEKYQNPFSRASKRIHGDILFRQNNEAIEIEIQPLNCNGSRLAKSYVRLNRETIPDLLCKEEDYSFRHPAVNHINREVSDFIEKIASELERQDPRFQVKPVVVGTSLEATKLDFPNEFEFCFVLTKISEQCEVSPSPELPPGFLHLKRKHLYEMGSEFDSFFNESNKLITDNINIQFTTMLNNAVTYVLGQQSCDWNLHMESGVFSYFVDRAKVATTLILRKMMNDPENKRIIRNISIDIVPCIHVDGWWPHDAISNVNDDIKAEGCFFVFDRPQRLYPWVPYTESCVMISFAKAEREIIKQSPDIAKHAFVIAKKMNKRKGCSDNYILKNSLLYCIEALTPAFEAHWHGLQLDESESNLTGMRSCLWLESLMKCNLDFVAQDFCPCYFMPAFSLPIEESLKRFYMDWILNNCHDYAERCIKAYELLLGVSNAVPEICLQLPSANLICEHFDRKQIITELSKTALKTLENIY